MSLTEDSILEMLSKSELIVYNYIKKKSQNGDSIKESMKQIGDTLDVSEATVHRAIRKLRKQGVIGIIPSVEKFESNEIIFYGVPDPKEQISEIFSMIGELSSSADRFEAVLKTKDESIDKLTRENEVLQERIEELEAKLAGVIAQNAGIDESKIISSQPLSDGTTAYIVKN